MGRFVPAVVAAGLLSLAISPAFAEAPALVLPFRTIGINDTTAAVFQSLLASELETHGVHVLPASVLPASIATGPEACDEAGCAAALAREAGAGHVVFGSLSRLGDKVIVRVRAITAGADHPDYSDQITALREDDLDAVARRIAEGLAAGRPNAERATVKSVTLQETETPRRRASRTGFGIRTGFLFPDGHSYGGSDRLAMVRPVFRYEASNLFVETTPLLGFAWGDGNVEWTMLDLTAGKLFGTGDWSPYFTGGLGVHIVTVAKRTRYTYADYYGASYDYTASATQTETTLAADAGVGMLALRTYDFSIVLELKYHAVFSSFDNVGGKGAHGITLSFGTTR